MFAKNKNDRAYYFIRGVGKTMAFYNRAVLDRSPASAVEEFATARLQISSASRHARKAVEPW
jgi:hypothetical protein